MRMDNLKNMMIKYQNKLSVRAMQISKNIFFVADKNKQSYEIHFNSMMQCNVQTGKQRKVRKIALRPKPFANWDGMKEGSFENGKEATLYCVVGDMTANEVKKCDKLIRGSLGPFGAGFYFYDDEDVCIQS